ncbi:hypothetical protein AK830_g1348 [Neonectria ditissima]|uniref:Uncharacterized protein n=1 Tax=Neonectria ditissima TaxID=78410 RepID=A0A0P7BEY7_9HYPO|nr:hypothetical protein AK830_g1348 [Neonectria ditissima]
MEGRSVSGQRDLAAAVGTSRLRPLPNRTVAIDMPLLPNDMFIPSDLVDELGAFVLRCAHLDAEFSHLGLLNQHRQHMACLSQMSPGSEQYNPGLDILEKDTNDPKTYIWFMS